ncbi:PAS domain S-box-containing protein [Natronoflexus pectinivorans]|uniref:histidine kinase n=2 Tax=Natronoflexus pectinivorans TaxID=682526 RepID=A0A4R2GP23_9BACT|nr:PAS domain S-box-containing protein [Natronoflexus pectinivorans]
MVSYGVSHFVMNIIALGVVVVIFYLAFRKSGRITKDSRDVPESQGKKTIRIVIAFLSLALFIGGIYIVHQFKILQEKEIRRELLSGAQSVAEGLSYRTISNLEFNLSDLDHPVYHQLNQQLREASGLLNKRDIYTMVLRDSQIIFGPESIDPELFHASLPGDVYKIPPQGLVDVFVRGNHLIVGPYEDEYGHFISAFYPVFRQHSPEPYMVVGMDIHEHEWNDEVNHAIVIPQVLVIVLLLILLFGNIIFSRPQIMRIERSIWWQSPEAIFTFIGSVFISLLIIWFSVRVENRYRMEIFKQSSSIQANQFRSYMRTFEWHLLRTSNSLGRFNEIEEDFFREEVNFLLELEFVESIGWAEEYSAEYLVRLVEGGYQELFSVGSSMPKISSHTINIIENAVSHQRLTTEAIISESSNTDPRLIIYIPFSFSGNSSNGLAYIVVNINKLLGRSVALRGSEENLFNVLFGVVENQSGYTYIGRFGDDVMRERKIQDMSAGYFLFMFGRTWKLDFFPGQFFNRTHPSIALPVSLSLAILMTLVLSFVVGLLSTRKIRLERDVEKRTQELNRSEQRFSLLFNSMAEGVAMHRVIRNEEGEILNYSLVDINAAYSRILGLARKDVIGKTASDLYGQPTAPFLDVYARVVQDGTPTRFEEYFPPMDRYFDVSAIPMSDDTFATVFTDVSHRVLAERTIRESEEKYRMISDNVGDVIWVMDAMTHKFRYMSPSVERLSGYSVDEALGFKLKDILSPESFEFVSESLPFRVQKFENGDETYRTRTVTLNQIKKDGGIIVTEVTTTLIPNEHGRVKEVLGVTRDVTEMVAAREALRLSEEKYRFLVENQHDFIIKVDLEGRYLYASPSFCHAIGKSDEEIMGKVFIPPIDSDSAVLSLEALEKLKKPPYRVRFEQKVKLNSEWKWISWDNSAILEEGEPVAYIGVGRDVTREKIYQEELKESKDKLQQQNEEYAMLNEEYQSINEEMQSTNEELVHAIERAQESENLKTAFLQNVSHEIRTPLNAIIGFSEMLALPDFEEGDKVNFSEIIVNSSRELLNLVNDILTISTIETQQDKMNLQKVILKDLLMDLNSVFSNNPSRKGVDLGFVLPPGVSDKFSIKTDELKLKQVFNNLIGNALKFTEKGEVVYGVESVDEKNMQVVFFVKDTGIGIPLKMQDKVFERFRQANPDVQTKYGGTGLGLAICKGHIELMGGKIWLESKPGKGSVFRFSIPI